MQYAHLGRSGVVVSRLCLGTMNFGWKTPEDESLAIMDKALELGINFFDTANAYGFKIGEGITESLLGKWFAQGGRRREQVVLATKVYVPMGHGVNERGLSAYHIRQACEESLRRMQTDHLDVYYMHHIDRGEPMPLDKKVWGLQDVDLVRPPHRKRETPWDEIWQAMEVLVQQGKVIYVASSNFAAWNIVQACEQAQRRNFSGAGGRAKPVSSERPDGGTGNRPGLPRVRSGPHPLEPAGGRPVGRDSGEGGEQPAGRRRRAVGKAPPQAGSLRGLLPRIGRAAGRRGHCLALRNPVVTSPIIGPRTMEQLTGSLRSLEVKLDAERWPGSTRSFPAPEAKRPRLMPGNAVCQKALEAGWSIEPEVRTLNQQLHDAGYLISMIGKTRTTSLQRSSAWTTPRRPSAVRQPSWRRPPTNS